MRFIACLYANMHVKHKINSFGSAHTTAYGIGEETERRQSSRRLKLKKKSDGNNAELFAQSVKSDCVLWFPFVRFVHVCQQFDNIINIICIRSIYWLEFR